MAKRKRSGRPPQAQHSRKSKPSQHDKRQRLATPNPSRRTTASASVPLTGKIATLVASMSELLDKRIGFRLPIIIAGAMLAGGRRTAASWFRCGGVNDDWDRFYEMLQSIGRRAGSVMLPLVMFIFNKFDPGENGHWTIAIDDSPTKRFGPYVEAANIHHNPTPGPGDGGWLYGHNWVCLAMVLNHPLFGAIALPLLSRLYVRKVDIDKLRQRYDWEFRTKPQLALELVQQVLGTLRALGSKAGFVVVFDGAYAVGELVRALIAEGATVVTRLRRDAKLYDVPINKTGQRGRPRKYGKNRISLAKRAGRRDGWKSITYRCRGVQAKGQYKTFLATSKVVGGQVRVVLLKHVSGNWAAYISTDTTMSVEVILQTVSDRWAIEEHFHDVKEIWGAGEQQVRNVWSSIACWNLCGCLYSMVELECWDLTSDQLVDRSDRPWDTPSRRPSHADRRRRITREMIRSELLNDLHLAPDETKMRDRFERLLALAT
ncbi:IS701 family transposase [Stieleria mannarensis]|uniref:IS701 family transposase n=1 Tax=Stieleria mannarensis TaxID=2755585 RepID=UPI003F51597A